MSDEQPPRRDSGGAPGPDETRRFGPFDDDLDSTRAAGNHPIGGPRSSEDPPLDRTQQMPAVPATGDDATSVTPRDGTAAMPPAFPAGGDATVVTPRDGTAVMPPARDPAGQDAAWAGRAEVRPPRPDQYTTAPEWETVPPTEPRGRWWMPILLGILALLLLGALGWGIYLIVQNSDDDPAAPAPTPSAPAPTTVATTEPTTTPPTTTPPTTTPTTTAPAEITVPALTGLSQQEAQQALDRRGLSYRLIFRPSDAQPGTVIDSDPAEGQEVPPDTQVTLVIAAERTTPPTTPATDATDQPDED